MDFWSSLKYGRKHSNTGFLIPNATRKGGGPGCAIKALSNYQKAKHNKENPMNMTKKLSLIAVLCIGLMVTATLEAANPPFCTAEPRWECCNCTFCGHFSIIVCGTLTYPVVTAWCFTHIQACLENHYCAWA
jgi:hypothetical protein